MDDDTATWERHIPSNIRSAAEAIDQWRARIPAARRLVDAATITHDGHIQLRHFGDDGESIIEFGWDKSAQQWIVHRHDPPHDTDVLGPRHTDLDASEAIVRGFRVLWLHTHQAPVGAEEVLS